MAIISTALTTVARVKSRLEIQSGVTTWDALIAELINGATEYIQGECSGRVFLSATYTQESYDVEPGQRTVYLRNFPVASISAIQYRAGTISNPSWTSVPVDDYQLLDGGRMGALDLLPSAHGNNALRVTYTAGYVGGFGVGHTLPYELSDLCERLAAKAFKARQSEGKSAEASQEVSTSWSRNLSTDDRGIIRRYNRGALL